MSSESDEFDLDVRFHGDPRMERPRAGLIPKTESPACQVVHTSIGCHPVNTLGPACMLEPTVVGQTCLNTCADTCADTCDRTCGAQQTCANTCPGQETCGVTCAGNQTCPADTCGLDCETDTCPDATCGCNTSETCNQDICDGGGGGITAPPCQDVSGGEDTCDACPPQTGGQPCDTMGGCPPGG